VEWKVLRETPRLDERSRLGHSAKTVV